MRHLFPLLALILFPLVAPASADALIEAERPIASLKRQVLAIQLKRDAAERRRRPGGLEIFLRSDMPELRIESLTIDLDGIEQQRIDYDIDAAQAYAAGGWARLPRIGLGSGRQQLLLRLHGHLDDADQAPVELAWRLPVEAEAEPLQLLLTAQPRARVATGAVPELQRVGSRPARGPAWLWRAADDDRASLARGSYHPGGAHDPRIAAARWQLAARQSLPALAGLLELLDEPADAHAYEVHLLRGHAYLQLGLYEDAERAYAQWAAEVDDRDAFVDVQLRLASYAFERGHAAVALQRLAAINGRLDAAQRQQRADLQARSLLVLGRPAEAAAILDALRAGLRTPYMRYNLGLAWMLAGDTARGLAELERLGASRASEHRERRLRDRANWLAGRLHLDGGNASRARELLARVSLDGAYAAPALLAAGQAALAELPATVPTDDAGRDALLDALRPWLALTEHDAMDPQVQEAMIAIPQLFEQADMIERALHHYRLAAAALESAIEPLEAGIQSLDDRSLIDAVAATGAEQALGRDWYLLGLPDMPATYWTIEHIASHDFQQGLRDYRDLGLIATALREWQTGPAPHGFSAQPDYAQLLDQAEALREAEAARLNGLLRGALQTRRELIDEQLLRARLAIARVGDRETR